MALNLWLCSKKGGWDKEVASSNNPFNCNNFVVVNHSGKCLTYYQLHEFCYLNMVRFDWSIKNSSVARSVLCDTNPHNLWVLSPVGQQKIWLDPLIKFPNPSLSVWARLIESLYALENNHVSRFTLAVLETWPSYVHCWQKCLHNSTSWKWVKF